MDLRKIVGPLDNLVAFDAAARFGNFSHAARELSVAQPAVSRRIAQLEKMVGTSLFERKGTRIRLTAAGIALHGVITSAFQAIERSVHSLPREDDDGIVTLRVNVAAAYLWLMPALDAFYAAFPDIRLHLICVDELPELGQGNADLEIRFGTGDWVDVECYPLLRERVYPVASPKFCQSHPIGDLQSLAETPLLQLANYTSPLMDWQVWLGQTGKPVVRRLTTYAMVLEAARLGHGVALGWHPYVRGLIEAGELVKLPVDDRTSPYREFLVRDPNRTRRYSVERTKNWILDLAARESLA